MKAMSEILIVDDEPSVCRSCTDILTREGWRVETALSGRECINRTRDKSFAVVILDLRMPDIGGTKLLQEIKQRHPETPVIIITGYSSVASAVETMKIGASDYLAKPFSPEQIRRAVEQATITCPAWMEKEQEGIINAEDVHRVLERASRDDKFATRLLEQDSEALVEFGLPSEANAALLSGDIQWLERHVGKLSETQKAWLNRRLQQESW